ncbi:MAG: sugar phosphate isomerase/epimerase [Gemmatimonadota bacterium]|nr:sugar phosphate isomerase/epimerase [Gemmatimonadota bacterium]
MDRRSFLTSLGLAAAATQVDCASAARSAAPTRRLRRVGIQLYTLRDDARRDLERTLGDIAAAGYKDVELLGGMNNFGMSPERLRAILDRNGLRAPSTHIGGGDLSNLDRQFAEAATLGHKYIILASIPGDHPTLDDYRHWADRLNEAGRSARTHGLWIGFHNEAPDFPPISGLVPYEVLVDRTDPDLVRLQLDTGNAAMGGRDPLDYMKRYGSRYWLFHIKDAPRLGSPTDTELGKGVIDFKRLLASIDHIDEKFLYVEQETYPGAPLDSARRDYEYLSKLEF